MKKLGTPTFAAPGGASVYVGSVGAGGCSGAGLGVAVTSGTAPVSDWTLPAACLGASDTWPAPRLAAGCLATGLPWLALPLPEPLWRGDVGVAVGAFVAVGEGESVTGAVVGVGVPSA